MVPVPPSGDRHAMRSTQATVGTTTNGRRRFSFFLVLSHLLAMVVAFHIGCLWGALANASSSASSTTATTTSTVDCVELLSSLNGNHGSSRPYTSSLDLPASVHHFATNMGRVTRKDFVEAFDIGIPWEPAETGNEEVLILYNAQQGMGLAHSSQQQNSVVMTVQQATANCTMVKLVLTEPNKKGTCVVIAGQRAPSYHIHKFLPTRQQKGRHKSSSPSSWKSVSRYAEPSRQETSDTTDEQLVAVLGSPPKPVSIRDNFHLLRSYLTIYEQALEDLAPMAKDVASRGKPELKNIIVVMVCSSGHVDLLLNYYCAANVVGVDLSNVLLFATDKPTYEMASALGLTTYYNEPLFSAIPNTTAATYGTREYAHVMMAKIYATHLVNALGYTVFFQDVDLVPHRPNYIEHFVQVAESLPEHDFYFQDDHNESPKYAPWGINSGFFLARCNQQTRYFFSVLLRMGDVILRSKSHQAVVAVLLGEHSSKYGLRVKTMHEVNNDFPVGYHFHKDRAYMKAMMENKITPYVFHMNWNNDKETKKKFNQQIGDWHVKEECVGKTAKDIVAYGTVDSFVGGACCEVQPIVKCYFRDKPSRNRCDDSPMIEDDTSFW